MSPRGQAEGSRSYGMGPGPVHLHTGGSASTPLKREERVWNQPGSYGCGLEDSRNRELAQNAPLPPA